MFDWDLRKAQSNRRKHGVSFEEAATANLHAEVLSIKRLQTAQKAQRRGARKADERRRTQRVRWSEAIERNEAYEAFSTVCDKE